MILGVTGAFLGAGLVGNGWVLVDGIANLLSISLACFSGAGLVRWL